MLTPSENTTDPSRRPGSNGCQGKRFHRATRRTSAQVPAPHGLVAGNGVGKTLSGVRSFCL